MNYPRLITLALAAQVLSAASISAQTEPYRPRCACPAQGLQKGPLPEYNTQNPLALWGPTATPNPGAGFGAPLVLTWGFAANGTLVPAAPLYGLTASATNTLRGAAASWSGGFPGFVADVTTYINEWNGLSGVSLIYDPADDGVPMDSIVAGGGAGGTGLRGVRGLRADIRIGGAALTGSVVGYSSFPAAGGDVVLDTSFAAIFNPATSLATRRSNLRSLIRHEIGHSLGLGHMCSNAPILMRPVLPVAPSPIHLDDRLGLHDLYGDAYEPDDSPATARPIGPLTSASVTEQEHSLDGKTALDSDFYRVTVVTPGMVRVTVTPTGVNYAAIPLLGPGLCAPGTAYATHTPATWADLRLVTVNGGGAALRPLVNRTLPGGAEVFEVPVTTAGVPVVIRVDQNLFSTLPQMYRITFQWVPLPTFPPGSTAQSGSVLNGAGLPENVMQINGSTGGVARRVDVPVGVPLQLRVTRPSVNTVNSGFALWALTTSPTGPNVSYGVIGMACFDLFSPLNLLVADSYRFFGQAILSAPILTSANPVYNTTTPAILTPVVITVQGFIESAAGVPRVTNAILLNIHQ